MGFNLAFKGLHISLYFFLYIQTVCTVTSTIYFHRYESYFHMTQSLCSCRYNSLCFKYLYLLCIAFFLTRLRHARSSGILSYQVAARAFFRHFFSPGGSTRVLPAFFLTRWQHARSSGNHCISLPYDSSPDNQIPLTSYPKIALHFLRPDSTSLRYRKHQPVDARHCNDMHNALLRLLLGRPQGDVHK